MCACAHVRNMTSGRGTCSEEQLGRTRESLCQRVGVAFWTGGRSLRGEHGSRREGRE